MKLLSTYYGSKTFIVPMASPRVVSIAFVSLVGSLLIGCQSQAPSQSSNMLIKSVGPLGIKAGVKFNVQPDGASAIWLSTEGVPATAVPVLSGVELLAVNVRDQGKLVTAVVPDKLTKVVGKYPLFLVDKKSGMKSNQFDLIVK